MFNTSAPRLLLTIIISSTVLTSCLVKPSRSYDENKSNVKEMSLDTLNIDLIKPTPFSTKANKAWQNTGIFLENGDIVNITASGTWSPAPIYGVSGPEGNSIWSPEVPGIPGSALIAKLGHDGKPFGIGINKTFQAKDYGMLYLAMNDPFNYQYDNTGSAEAEIYIDGNEDKVSRASLKIVSYKYDDKSKRGFLSAEISNNHFKTRQKMIKKIGEIASSKNIAINAGNEPVEGGNYKIGNEDTDNGILTIKFETLW